MSFSSSASSVAHRKAQIEAKKAKLEEIRRQREERAQRLKSTSSAIQESSTSTSSRKDLDDLVNSLISGQSGPSRSSRSSIIGTEASSPRKSLLVTSRAVSGSNDPPSSDFGESESELPSTQGAPTATTTPIGDALATSAPLELIDVETELFELPQKQRVFYTKEVQTTAVGDSDDEYSPRDFTSGGASGGVVAEARLTKETEESLRAKILAEHQADLAARQEEQRLEQEIAQQLRELSDEERLAVYSAQDFSDFVQQSSKIVERALTDRYDYMRDYRISADDSLSTDSRSQLRLARRFGMADKMLSNRSVTAIDWSTKYPELCVVAYNRDPTNEDAPDGLVAVWNMHLGERPEFVFHAQTDVVSVIFSPFHPNLIVGGTYSGQILIWDTRARHLPVLKTPLSAAGHTHPVYGLKIIGSANANNLVSASTDGTICWWMLDMLARPQETLELVNTMHAKTDEVAVTSLGVVDQETTSFLVGSEDGNVYAGNRYDRAGLKAGLNMAEVYRGHVAPVTGIDFHPLNGSVDFSDLFLTSSMDWTSRLWRLKPAASTTASGVVPSASAGANRATSSGASGAAAPVPAILTFEESNDYIYDVRWSTCHPAVFAQVDGTGRLDVFNLNVDTERPVASVYASCTPNGSAAAEMTLDATGGDGAKALNKLAWSKTGRQLATGGSDGVVYVYEVNDTLCIAPEEEVALFQTVIARLLAASATTPVPSTR